MKLTTRDLYILKSALVTARRSQDADKKAADYEPGTLQSQIAEICINDTIALIQRIDAELNKGSAP